jgi:hypothetical protein
MTDILFWDLVVLDETSFADVIVTSETLTCMCIERKDFFDIIPQSRVEYIRRDIERKKRRNKKRSKGSPSIRYIFVTMIDNTNRLLI